MSKNAYIFFEPLSNDYFQSVVDIYIQGLKEYLIDNLHTFIDYFNDSNKNMTKILVDNYYNILHFPSCLNIMRIDCKGRLCGKEIKIVLTKRQETQFINSINKVINELKNNYSDFGEYFEKIKQRCPWYDNLSEQTIRIDKKHDDHDSYLDIYIRGIDTRSKQKYNAKKFIYVCAEKAISDFTYIENRTSLKPFKPCRKIKI